MPDDEKKEEKPKAPAAKQPPPPAPERDHLLTLNEVAEDPAPSRPIIEPQPLEPVMPRATDAQVQAALNRVAEPAPSAKAAPPKAAAKRRLIRIDGQEYDLAHLLTGAAAILIVSVLLFIWFAALVKDNCTSHRKTHPATPASAHVTHLMHTPPVLICDEKSAVTVAADHMDFTGCYWSPPLSASTPPRTLYCDDTNSPTVMLDGSVRFTDCKPK